MLVTVTTALPSQTMLTAAAARAAHLVVDSEPVVFRDPLAAALLGDRADELIGYHRAHGAHPVLAGARAQVTCRSRVAEGLVADGGQYVLLGAGLDSFAYRSTGTAVFEVDQPAAQNWKKQALETAGIPIPDQVTFAESIVDCDLDETKPTLVSWLGVAMYLTLDEIESTLAALPPCDLVLDHMLPEGERDAAGDAYVAAVGPMAAEHGEPWRTFLSADDAAALLADHGFTVVRQLRQRDLPEMHDRADALRPAELSVLTHAVRTGSRTGSPRRR